MSSAAVVIGTLRVEYNICSEINITFIHTLPGTIKVNTGGVGVKTCPMTVIDIKYIHILTNDLYNTFQHYNMVLR